MQNLIVSRNPARRTAKQKAASKRNIKKAQAARRRGGRRRTTRRRRRRNPYNQVTRARASNQARRRRRVTARLPTFNRILNDQVIPAFIGGTGAVVNDIVVNMLPLPPQFKTGWMRHMSKAVGAIAIGYLGAMFLQKKTADALGAGAMTVVGYNVVRDFAAQWMPQIPLGEYLDVPLGYYGAGLDPTVGEYLAPDIGMIPGSGMETAGQFTRGSPYMGVDAWPTGSAYDDMQY